MKLNLGTPRVIAQGPTWEEVKWGPYQFPSVRKTNDGRLIAAFSVVQDRVEDFGLERGWALSEDNGASWRRLTPDELDAFRPWHGTRLPDGSILSTVTKRPIILDEETHKALMAKARRAYHTAYLGAEDVPEGLVPVGEWTCRRFDPATGETEVYQALLDFPGQTFYLSENGILVPAPQGSMRVAPDGSLWMAMYLRGRSPYNLGYTGPYYACYCLQSTDNGRSFRLRSWIPYRPSVGDFARAYGVEGFCEPDIAFMPDGSMIILMRTDGHAPSYIARSTDGGSTWSEPVMFDTCGVLPHLLTLKCGVTLASYGRPGVFVRATKDPSGLVWEEPVTVIPADNCHSCCYTDMLALDDRTALLMYTDFTVPDADGVARKSIMCRTISVEE